MSPSAGEVSQAFWKISSKKAQMIVLATLAFEKRLVCLPAEPHPRFHRRRFMRVNGVRWLAHMYLLPPKIWQLASLVRLHGQMDMCRAPFILIKHR